jgi:hypothetical protein
MKYDFVVHWCLQEPINMTCCKFDLKFDKEKTKSRIENDK